MRLPDDKTFTVWRCQQCNDICEVDVTFFQDNGTPMCPECDDDMLYDRTYLYQEYDCYQCPSCESRDIARLCTYPIDYSKLGSDCECRNCGATWKEQGVVLDYTDLVMPAPDEPD